MSESDQNGVDESVQSVSVSSQKNSAAAAAATAATAVEFETQSHRVSNRVEDYQIVSDIGSGQFGVVQKISLITAPKDKPKYFVWKKIRYVSMHDSEKRQLAHEVQLLQALHHRNVVRYCGKINDSNKGLLYLIMEFCDGGDLGRYLEHTVKKGHYLPESLILSWFRQLVDGLHYCHTRETGKVLHRDLKPQNILLSNKYKKVKLADFGLAKMLQPTQAMAKTHVGTPFYMSPEVLNRFEYGEKSDIWSLGCLLYEMTTGLSPFGHASNYQDLCQLVRDGELSDGTFPSIYDQEILNTIQWMLSHDPDDRPTTTEIKDSVLYKWSSALKHSELSQLLKGVVSAQQAEIRSQAMKIQSLQKVLSQLDEDFKFFEDCIQFQNESDKAIRKSLCFIKRFFPYKEPPP